MAVAHRRASYHYDRMAMPPYLLCVAQTAVGQLYTRSIQAAREYVADIVRTRRSQDE